MLAERAPLMPTRARVGEQLAGMPAVENDER
jgi:hypothetical protein